MRPAGKKVHHSPTHRIRYPVLISLAVCLVGMGIGACNTMPMMMPTGNDPVSGGSVPGATTSVLASKSEQLSMERINRARLLPAAEAAMYSIAIDEGVAGQIDTQPKQPVALNAALNRSARNHSQDMLARNYFEHETPEGKSPFDRMQDAGYTFVAAGENLAWRGTTGPVDEVVFTENEHSDLFVDNGIAGRGHRVTMLNATYREVGISILQGTFIQNGTTFNSLMQTQDYGLAQDSPVIVLGVVYTDANHNGRYDFGEGNANSTVQLDTVAKYTNAGGGYDFRVSQAGDYTLRFASGRTANLTLRLGGPNVKVDEVDGNRVVINLGLGPLP